MATASLAPRKRSEQPLCWLLGLARAALAWAFISLTTLLPLPRLPEMHVAECALLVAVFVLFVGTGLVLLLWAADAVRDRR
jgi:hypothetical protein